MFHTVVRAPAKVNLALRVVGRRADGYHLLDMLNATLDLSDEIELSVEEGKGVSIELIDDGCEGASLVPVDPAENLCGRAVREFLAAALLDAKVAVTLRKRIPVGGGLGGGSSDCAAVLRALNEWAGTRRLTDSELERIALELGADVPYLLHGGLSRVSGIGESVRPLDAEGLSGYPILLIVPAVRIPTVSVFVEFKRAGEDFSPPLEFTEETFRSIDGLIGVLDNGLEPAASRLAPEIGRILSTLREFDEFAAVMTGSGSTVCCIPRRRGGVEEARRRLESAAIENVRIIETALVTRHLASPHPVL